MNKKQSLKIFCNIKRFFWTFCVKYLKDLWSEGAGELPFPVVQFGNRATPTVATTPSTSVRKIRLLSFQFLWNLRAGISEKNSEGGLHVDLAHIIEACDVCLKEDDKDGESVMNSMVSLLLTLEQDKQEVLIENLCERDAN